MTPQEFLKNHGGRLAALSFSGAGAPAEMNARVLKETADRLVLAFSTGDSSFVLKHFIEGAPKFQQAYLKERDGLRLFAESGLIPQITHHNDASFYIVQKYVPGWTIREVISEENSKQFCRTIGFWLKKYYDYAPAVAVTGNWLEHLQRVHGLRSSLEPSGFLRSFPLEKLTMCRADGALGNLILSVEGRLFGIDFERSAWQPFGWDLLLTARSVVRKFPHLSEPCIEALAEGFCRGQPERAKRWSALAKIFVAATLFMAPAKQEKHSPEQPQSSGSPSGLN
ncbi:hypothetical protein [Leisingera sp. McT4-56]|uniref:hypothetical protein n=1 Tax=Leisingera sp. McT4-56 TaxID=2881255 RepID=UPI001CF878FE|nr:hypothetical protein [Leisingera sp. McT4-56]MCB4458031.1 hypothetical protein [Leisingera sp. McT4-56]